MSPYDIRPLNLSPDDHSVTVFITDVFGQTTQFSFDFSTIPTTPITLKFTARLSLVEGTDTNVSSLFSIAGQALENIPLSLESLTYQAFEEKTGMSVSSIFSDIPPAASESMMKQSFTIKI